MMNQSFLNFIISVFIVSILGFLFYSNNNQNDHKFVNLYEKNLNHYKDLVEDINLYFDISKQDSIDLSNYYTDDFRFHSFPASFKKGVITTKEDYINGFMQMRKMNMSLDIGHSIYLPGIDQDSYKIDGSVRVYYGAELSLDTNIVEFSGYRTINFEAGKISEIWEWADYGGVNLLLSGNSK